MAATRKKVAETPAPSARCAPDCWAKGAGDRPARVQLDLSSVRLQATEVSGDYNIWYGKFSGERGYARSAPAATRCHLDTDAGLTLADHTESNAPLCLHFARGACAYGHNCNFRHRAPLAEDESSSETRIDLFGRERHASPRDDMGGVGSWSRDMRTLYVGRVCVLDSEAVVHARVWAHFSEWGEIDYCRVLMNKGCAFVSYRLRCAAEFAKEAMADQALEHDEQINLRWATEDPNPRAKAERLRINAQLLLGAMRAKGHLPAAGSAEPFFGEELERDAKRARADGSLQPAPVAAPATREEAEAAAEALLQAAEEEAEAEATLAAAQAELHALSKLDSILSRIGGVPAELEAAAERSGGGDAERAGKGEVVRATIAASSTQRIEQPLAAELHGEPLPPGVGDEAEEAARSSPESRAPPGVTLQPRAAAEPSGHVTSESEWAGAWDSASGQVYYHNRRTGESRWAWEWDWAAAHPPTPAEGGG